MKPPPKEVSLNPERAEAYVTELHQSSLDPSVARAIEKIIRTYMWLIWSLQETQLSLKRFRQMVFGAPARASQQPCAQSDTTAESIRNRPCRLRIRPLQCPGQADAAAILRVRVVLGRMRMWERSRLRVATTS